MFMFTSRVALAAGLTGALFASSAWAIPTSMVFIDTTEDFNARISDGALAPGVNVYPLIFGVNWTANFTVTTTNGAASDALNILGTVQHLIPPPAPLHGEGPGPQWAYLANFDSAGFANGFYGFGDQMAMPPLPHGNHVDEHHAFGTVEIAAGRIVSYHIDIRAHHTPTPGTPLLAALAATCMTRRRREPAT